MAEENTTPSTEGTAPAGPTGAPGGPAPTPTPSTEPAPSTTPEPTFTQADLDRHAGRRAAEAKRAAAKEFADELGVSLDQAKQIIADRQAAAEAEKTEIQKAQDARQAAERERDEAKTARAQADRASAIKEKLLLRGVGAQFDPATEDGLKQKRRVLEGAMAIVERFAAADADDDALDLVIEENVAIVPGFLRDLTKPADEPRTPAPSGVTNGAQPPAGGQPTKTALERGRERARAAQANTPTSGDPLAGLRTA